MDCKICGKPSGMYPLCKDCFKLRDEGKVVKCETCGEWHRSESPCKCTPSQILTEKKSVTCCRNSVICLKKKYE